MLSAERSPAAVFAGAALAFLVQTVVAVAAGGLIAKLPTKAVRVAGGLMFLVFAALVWRRKQEAGEVRPAEGPRSLAADVTASFLVIFTAEWGDLTQLATAVLESEQRRPLLIGSAAVLALWTVTALAAWLGGALGKRLEPRKMNAAASVAFACVGALLLFQALR